MILFYSGIWYFLNSCRVLWFFVEQDDNTVWVLGLLALQQRFRHTTQILKSLSQEDFHMALSGAFHKVGKN